MSYNRDALAGKHFDDVWAHRAVNRVSADGKSRERGAKRFDRRGVMAILQAVGEMSLWHGSGDLLAAIDPSGADHVHPRLGGGDGLLPARHLDKGELPISLTVL